MFLLVPAHPGFPGQIPQSRKTVVCVCVLFFKNLFHMSVANNSHVINTCSQLCEGLNSRQQLHYHIACLLIS